MGKDHEGLDQNFTMSFSFESRPCHSYIIPYVFKPSLPNHPQQMYKGLLVKKLELGQILI